jgi:hypothetical protein
VGVPCGGRVSEEDEGEGIWWMNIIYLNEINETSCICFKWGGEGVEGSLFRTVTMNSPCTMNIS